MKAMSTIASLLTVVITLPIWFYLLYQVLVRVEASELMFFLFWIYLPSSVFCHVVFKLSERK